MSLEGVELIGFGGNAFIKGGKAVGDALLLFKRSITRWIGNWERQQICIINS